MLVSPGNSGVHADIPRDQALCVSLGLQLFEDPFPDAVALPAPTAMIDFRNRP